MGALPRGALVASGIAVLAIAFGLDFERMRTHAHVIDALYLIAALLFAVALFDWIISFWRKREDDKPRIALSAQIGKAFALVHLGGDSAQHVQIEPIQSNLGRPLWIRFEAVDFLNSARPEAYPHFKLDMQGMQRESDMGKLGFVFFGRDAAGKETEDYPIRISFLWKGRKMMESQTLTFHTGTLILTTSEASK
jgi:hypothetical protein